jgi:hypothetical protein
VCVKVDGLGWPGLLFRGEQLGTRRSSVSRVGAKQEMRGDDATKVNSWSDTRERTPKPQLVEMLKEPTQTD